MRVGSGTNRVRPVAGPPKRGHGLSLASLQAKEVNQEVQEMTLRGNEARKPPRRKSVLCGRGLLLFKLADHDDSLCHGVGVVFTVQIRLVGVKRESTPK